MKKLGRRAKRTAVFSQHPGDRSLLAAEKRHAYDLCHLLKNCRRQRVPTEMVRLAPLPVRLCGRKAPWAFTGEALYGKWEALKYMLVRKTGQKKPSPAENAALGRILLPVVLELIFAFVIANLNTLIISRFLANAVAATTAVGTFLSLMLNLYSVFYAGAGILLAPYWGCQQFSKGSNVWTVALVDNFLFSMLLGAVGFLGHSSICGFLKVPMELREMAGGYLMISLGLSAFQGFNLTCCTAFRAIGSMQVSMAGNTLISGSCVLLNFLVLTLVPAQKQTIYHFTWAGIVAQMLGSLFYLWMMRTDKRIELRLFHGPWRQGYLQTTGKIFRLGFFGGMEGVLYLLCQTVVISMIGRLGTRALQISGYSANVMNYLTTPANAFAIATATVIGLALGAGDEEKTKRCLRKSLLLALSATVALEAAAMLFGRKILRLYLSDGAMLDACMQLITVDLAVEIARCVAAIMVSSLKAIGDVRTPFLMVLLGGALNISVSWLLGIHLGFGLPGVWAGYGADLALRGIVGLCVWNVRVAHHSYPILGQTLEKTV